jgi:hypothetical protein
MLIACICCIIRGDCRWAVAIWSRGFTIPCYVQQVLQFNWAVYSLHGGHFASTIQSHNLPFHVKLACDPYESGQSLFQEFTSCKQIFNSTADLLNHIIRLEIHQSFMAT